MKFSYKAFDKAGKPREATLEAPTAADASEVLRRDGLFVAQLTPIAEASHANPRVAALKRRVSGGGRVKGGRIKTLSGFMRHLSVLVSTGTPITDALQALEEQSRDPVWKGI